MAAQYNDMISKVQYVLMFSGLGVGFLDFINPLLQTIALLITIGLGGFKFYDRFKNR